MPKRGYVGAKRIGSKTNCGITPRARVVRCVGNRCTYRFPCGYELTNVMMIGPRGARKPADEWTMQFMARYWQKSNGVIYQCPRCLREERKAQRGVKR